MSPRESTPRTMLALLRQGGLRSRRRRLAIASLSCGGLVLVFFVHKLRFFNAAGQRLNARLLEAILFRPAIWPAIRREYLDLNRRSARRRPLRAHHIIEAPDAPRPRL